MILNKIRLFANKEASFHFSVIVKTRNYEAHKTKRGQFMKESNPNLFNCNVINNDLVINIPSRKFNYNNVNGGDKESSVTHIKSTWNYVMNVLCWTVATDVYRFFIQVFNVDKA